MTVHKIKQTETKAKTKIISPLKPNTTLLPKKRKKTKKINKIDRSKRYFYNPITILTMLAKSKIQHILVGQYKVHSSLV